MRRFFIIVIIFSLCACGSQPIPQWMDTSSRQLENYKINFLADKEDETEPHFAKAKKAISSSNDLYLLATLYLTKYALNTAALEDFDATDFLRIIKLQPDPGRIAYYEFLRGNFAAVDKSRLPADYRNLWPLIMNKDSAAAPRQIAAISDPLSRLIACGIWVKYLPYDESVLQQGIDTSAAQGWRRPLWAYLTRLQKYYSDRQDTTKAESIRERLELLKQ
jgi:hypothetical protein